MLQPAQQVNLLYALFYRAIHSVFATSSFHQLTDIQIARYTIIDIG